MARVEHSIEVNVPVSVAYEKLTQFEEFPRFMKGVHSVHQLDEAHLHWRAEKGGREMEWDAEITEKIPDKRIAWRNTSGPRNEGWVEFQALEQAKTKISLYMDADETYLRHPDSLYSDAPQDEGDLARFKKMVESQTQAASSYGGLGAGATSSSTAGASSSSSTGARSGTTGARSATGTGSAASSSAKKEAGQGGERAAGSDRAAGTHAGQTQAVWDDPMRIVRRVGEEMEQFLGRWIGPGGSGVRRGMMPLSRGQGEWMPPVDIEQVDGQLHICADLPGVNRDDVQIEIVRGQLLIEGERRGALGRHRQAHRHAECNRGHFYRSIPLPEGVDPDSAKASMHDGVLDITLQVATAPSGARRLNIQG